MGSTQISGRFRGRVASVANICGKLPYYTAVAQNSSSVLSRVCKV